MGSKKTGLAFAAISVLPISQAGAALAASTATVGSPLPGTYTGGAGIPLQLEVFDDGKNSGVEFVGPGFGGTFIGPLQYGPFPGVGTVTQRGPDGAPLYSLNSKPAKVVAGDIYFENPATQSISAMIRFYPDGGETAGPFSSASTFSVFSFLPQQGTPDGSPFVASQYPIGVSAAGGVPGMPTVMINETYGTGPQYVAPSGDPSDPDMTGIYSFTFIPTPEPASGALVGIGAAILLRRRPRR